MFKKIFLGLCLLFAITVAEAQTTKVLGIRSAAAADTDILFWLNFDNGNDPTPYDMLNPGAGDGDEYSAGDTSLVFNDGQGCTAGDSCVDATAAKNGSYGWHAFHNDSAWLALTVTPSSGDIIDADSGGIAMWYQGVSNVTDQRLLVWASNGTHTIIVRAISSGIYLEYADGGAGCSASIGSSTTTGVWHFVEAYWDTGNDIYTVKVYPSGGAQSTSSNGTGTCTAITGINDMWFGSRGSVGLTGVDTYLDNIMLTNNPTKNLYLLRDTNESPR